MHAELGGLASDHLHHVLLLAESIELWLASGGCSSSSRRVISSKTHDWSLVTFLDKFAAAGVPLKVGRLDVSAALVTAATNPRGATRGACCVVCFGGIRELSELLHTLTVSLSPSYNYHAPATVKQIPSQVGNGGLH